MITAFVCTTTLLVLHQTAHAAAPILDRIREAQHATHRCERQLGLKPTPASARPPAGARYRRWVLHLWQTRQRIVCGLVTAANQDPRVAIRVTFGPKRYHEASRVAWCESRYDTQARNGQYHGTWQMGENERATYGHGDTPLEQGFAARRYFDQAGWRPWECAYLTGVI